MGFHHVFTNADILIVVIILGENADGEWKNVFCQKQLYCLLFDFNLFVGLTSHCLLFLS